MNNVIMGILLEFPDIQRNNQRIDSRDYTLINEFVNSVVKYNYKCVILHNNLDSEFIDKYSNDNVSFSRCYPKDEYNLYINKWLCIDRHLQKFGSQYDKVMISDLTDVVLLKEGLFDYIEDQNIYCGSETSTLANEWIKKFSLDLQLRSFQVGSWYKGNTSKTLLNAGLLAGTVPIVSNLVNEICSLLKGYCKYSKDVAVEMLAFNYVMYYYEKHYKLNYGEPFHTVFKGYDLSNVNCYVAHK